MFVDHASVFWCLIVSVSLRLVVFSLFLGFVACYVCLGHCRFWLSCIFICKFALTFLMICVFIELYVGGFVACILNFCWYLVTLCDCCLACLFVDLAAIMLVILICWSFSLCALSWFVEHTAYLWVL